MKVNNFTDRYRPENPAQVIGSSQRRVVESLLDRAAKGELVQTLLLLGPFGVGKTTIARLYIEKVLGKSYHEARGIEIQHFSCKDKGGVAFVRDAILPQLRTPPIQGDYTIFFLDEIHGLTSDAVDALLVEFENLPKHIIIVGASTEPANKLNSGLVSRFQETHVLQAPSGQEMTRLIRGIASKEGHAFSSSEIGQLIASADGNVRQLVANVGSALAGSFEYLNPLEEDTDLVTEVFKDQMDISAILRLNPTLSDTIGLCMYSVAVMKNSPNSVKGKRAQLVVGAFGGIIFENLPDNRLFSVAFARQLLSIQ